MADDRVWVRAVRESHDRLAALVGGMGADDLARRSACSDWTVAQVLSHLGSQAEIFELFVDAGTAGGDPPAGEVFRPIWDRWDSKDPAAQAGDSLEANARFVEHLEALGDEELAGFRLAVFGREVDAAGLLRMRLSEHAVHSWDVAVAFYPDAEVAAGAVELLIDGLGETAARGGRPQDRPPVAITTTRPDRRFLLRPDGVTLELHGGSAPDAAVELPGEAFLRLVYGRLDDSHPPRGPVQASGVGLAELEAIFPGL